MSFIVESNNSFHSFMYPQMFPQNLYCILYLLYCSIRVYILYCILSALCLVLLSGIGKNLSINQSSPPGNVIAFSDSMPLFV